MINQYRTKNKYILNLKKDNFCIDDISLNMFYNHKVLYTIFPYILHTNDNIHLEYDTYNFINLESYIHYIDINFIISFYDCLIYIINFMKNHMIPFHQLSFNISDIYVTNNQELKFYFLIAPIEAINEFEYSNSHEDQQCFFEHTDSIDTKIKNMIFKFMTTYDMNDNCLCILIKIFKIINQKGLGSGIINEIKNIIYNNESNIELKDKNNTVIDAEQYILEKKDIEEIKDNSISSDENIYEYDNCFSNEIYDEYLDNDFNEYEDIIDSEHIDSNSDFATYRDLDSINNENNNDEVVNCNDKNQESIDIKLPIGNNYNFELSFIDRLKKIFVISNKITKGSILYGNDSFCIDRTILIGNSNVSDIFIDDDTVSKEHSIVFKKRNKFYLVDCDTNIGTFLNGIRIKTATPIKLKDLDIIKINDKIFKFRLEIYERKRKKYVKS